MFMVELDATEAEVLGEEYEILRLDCDGAVKVNVTNPVL